MLPSPPPHQLLRDETEPTSAQPFLEVRRETFRLRYAGDTGQSEPFVYDTVTRSRLDAVIVAAHFRDDRGRIHVYLRSAVRPPVAMRDVRTSPMPERGDLGALWELPAGLVEEHERSAHGVRECAARELQEELGFKVNPSDLKPLGPATFPAPGMVAERQFFFHVPVNPATRSVPSEDGSPLERFAEVLHAPLRDLLELARNGGLEDAKTELALRRLQELLPPEVEGVHIPNNTPLGGSEAL